MGSANINLNNTKHITFTTAMFILRKKAGKEVMVPVSVVEEDCIIYIARDLYKIYEKNMRTGAELIMIRQEPK